jgi:hypothetical protein
MGKKKLTELDKHLVNRLVLLKVLSERENGGKSGQDFTERNVIGGGGDHAGDTTSGVVEQTGVVVGAAGKEALEFLQDGVVLAKDALPVLREVAKKTHSVGGVRLSVLVLVGDAVEQERHELFGVGGDTVLHVLDAVRDDTDAGAALTRFRGAGVLENVLSNNFPDLGVLRAESDGKSEKSVHRRVNKHPVVLRGLLEVELLIFLKVVQLSRVLLGEDQDKLSGDLEDDSAVGVGEDSRTASLEGLPNVLEDGGNSGPGNESACNSDGKPVGR